MHLRYLCRGDVESMAVSMVDIIDVLRIAFEEKGRGNVEMPPKPGVHPGGADNFIHAMPASIPALGSVGMKWVSGYPANPERGLPYISGLLILNDPDTGLPIAVMDCVWITAMRTAAASALSAQYLARPDSRTLGILGCGVQGRTHVEALCIALPNLERLRVFDVDHAKAVSFAQDMADRHGLQAKEANLPKEAVSGCDVVVTAGPILMQPHATIKPGWLDPGTFVAAVDFDSYFDPDVLLREFDMFTTDDTAQLRHFQQLGYFQHVPEISADLGELVTGIKAGRASPSERTIACNLGLALGDVSVAQLVLERARTHDVGTMLPL